MKSGACSLHPLASWSPDYKLKIQIPCYVTKMPVFQCGQQPAQCSHVERATAWVRFTGCSTKKAA